jgi:hypothetical protein
MLLELTLSNLLLAEVAMMLRSWCLWVEECGAGEVTSIDDCCWWPEAKEKKIGNKQG